MTWRWWLVLALLASGCGKSSKPKPAPAPGSDAAAGSDDTWDFYLAKVDDAPASLMIDFQYETTAPPAGADTLYVVMLAMREPGEHGLGTATEGAAIKEIEVAIAERARAMALLHVGRLKNHGVTDISFYGAPGKLDALRAAAGAAPLGGRAVDVVERSDAAWSYYKDFLLPNAERRQWIGDNRVVEALTAEGDQLVTPRRVDHWAYFPTPEARQRFTDGALLAGFQSDATTDDNDPPNVYGAQVFRTDPVELESIHAVVMTLVALAEQSGGDYDGWETEVVKP
jgi:hypothetical protein